MIEDMGRGRLVTLALILVIATRLSEGVTEAVHDVTPTVIGCGGDVLITINGENFVPPSVFSLTNVAENRVYFVSNKDRVLEGSVLKDGSIETRLMVYTPKDLCRTNLVDEEWYLRVVVDSVTIDDSKMCGGNPRGKKCTLKPTRDLSPTLETLSRQSVKIGDTVKIGGKICTDRTNSTKDRATNGDSSQVRRAYAGTMDCKGTIAQLESEESNYGTIECGIQGKSVGFYSQLNYIVGQPYGGSTRQRSLERVSRCDKIYAMEIYTAIDSISTQEVGLEGGQPLTVYLNYVSENYPSVSDTFPTLLAKVGFLWAVDNEHEVKLTSVHLVAGTIRYSLLDGRPMTHLLDQHWLFGCGDRIQIDYQSDENCPISSIMEDECFVCTVPPNPNYNVSSFPGNRGANRHRYDGITVDTLQDIRGLTPESGTYSFQYIDGLEYADTTSGTYASKLEAFFWPQHSGWHRIIVTATGGDVLMFFNNEEVANNTDLNLEDTTEYLVEVFQYVVNDVGSVSVTFKYLDTAFTFEYTGASDGETHRISVTSKVRREVQRLTFYHETATKQNEKQMMVIHSAQGPFQLCLLTTCSGHIPASPSETEISQKLNELASLLGDAVSVERQDTEQPTFVLDIETNRGDYPSFTYEAVYDDRPVDITIIEDINGIPDMDTISLMFGESSRPSRPFSIAGVTENNLQETLMGMFGATCPSFIASPGITRSQFEDYETEDSKGRGWRTKEAGSFSGNYALQNPRQMFQLDEREPLIDLSIYPYLCFAYKGVMKDMIRLCYEYDNGIDPGVRTELFDYSFKKDSAIESTTWYYTCVNLHELIMSRHANYKNLKLMWVDVDSSDDNGNIYVDAVYVGSKMTTEQQDDVLKVCLLNALSHRNAIMRDVSVTCSSSNTSTVCDVTLIPYDCASSFPLFSLTNGFRIDTTGSEDTATYGLLNQPNQDTVVMKTERISSATPAVTGLLLVTVNGKTTPSPGLNVSHGDADLTQAINSISGVNLAQVVKTGTCDAFDMEVIFKNNPGNLPQLEINTDGLHGNEVSATVTTVLDGGLRLPSNVDVFTVHSKPQVRVWVNCAAVECAVSTGCDIEWTNDATPILQSSDPPTVTGNAMDTTLTIEAMGLGTSSTITVTTGNIPCNLIETSLDTTPQILKCTMGAGPAGEVPIMVLDSERGLARSNAITFTYVAGLNDINPKEGSIAGGISVTATGFGFSSTTTASFGNEPAEIVSWTHGELKFTAPMSPSKKAATVDVVIDISGTTFTSQFTYSEDMTPTFTTPSDLPTSIPVYGGSYTFEISNAGNILGVVLGKQPAESITGLEQIRKRRRRSALTTTVTATWLSVSHGINFLEVLTETGYAALEVDSSFYLPFVTTPLIVNDVYPLSGSLYGGTVVTVIGEGFGSDSSRITATVGDHQCDVNSATDSKFLCTIADTGKIHYITNGGVHPEFGSGYAFQQSSLEINVGDIVKWQWSMSSQHTNGGMIITQVEDATQTDLVPNGFNSGRPTQNGQYEYRFFRSGIFFALGSMIGGSVTDRMTIKVTDKLSHQGLIRILVSNQEPLIDRTAGTNPVDDSVCPGVNTFIDGRNENVQDPPDNAGFHFNFLNSMSPSITSISPSEGTSSTDFTITGNGFGSTICQNKVLVGSFDPPLFGVVSAVSTESFTFSVPEDERLSIATLYEFRVQIGNHGYALNTALTTHIGIDASINSLSPSFGSVNGGTLLSIQGFGFDENPEVFLGNSVCPLSDDFTTTFTEIRCVTPESSGGSSIEDVHVRVKPNGQRRLAKCTTTTEKCQFTYDHNKTPVVNSITPTTADGPEVYNLIGENFLFDGVPNTYSVSIGNLEGDVLSVSPTNMHISFPGAPLGSNAVIITHNYYGKAISTVGITNITGLPVVKNISPLAGSVHGGTTLSIDGNGFSDDVAVLIGGFSCDIKEWAVTMVKCSTPSHAAANDLPIELRSGGVTFETSSFLYTYNETASPFVDSLSPSTGFGGEQLTVYGSNFNGSPISIWVGENECANASSIQDDEASCTLPDLPTGEYSVSLRTRFGNSNSFSSFIYPLNAADIYPLRGSLAGGQLITIDGNGWGIDAEVTICGKACEVQDVSAIQITCLTPANPVGECNITALLNGIPARFPIRFTYDDSLTPKVTDLTPQRGGTGGGTMLTIEGEGFGEVKDVVSVSIDGSVCEIQTVTETEITCITDAHSGTVVADVRVEVGGTGAAQTSEGKQFEYIDVWSSRYTWGGGLLPQAGEIVVIQRGQTVLLDTETPVLKFLLINGGKLIFDEGTPSLNAEGIMINDAGSLLVGTQDNPYQGERATITLHGNVRSKELPVYGAKTLAVRNGTLDLAGRPIRKTWTYLAETAQSGSNTITVTEPNCDWKVGGRIIIATTGDPTSQIETEENTISAISDDCMTFTLDKLLVYEHKAESETFDGRIIYFRAEVAYMSRNILLRGSINENALGEFHECPEGFTFTEHGTQTCFVGRLGKEQGSDEFGVTVVVHSPDQDNCTACVYISYIEMTEAGQAYRLGRYAIHLHVLGNSDLCCLLRGIALYGSYNRAVNIHKTHKCLVEHNIAYNVKGGAFFLEDGIETGNVIQYNLALLIRSSSSLLNDDITPAAFWATHPWNTISHNAVAGCTNFGFWYRLHEYPDGLSFTKDECPRNAPLGRFYNNSVHSCGGFGLWIFPDYFPLAECGGSIPAPAQFIKFFAWFCDKGAETVNVAYVAFIDFVMVHNTVAGLEGKLVTDAGNADSGESYYWNDSLIVGSSSVLQSSTDMPCTNGGVVLPYGPGVVLSNVTFVNFNDDKNCVAIRATRIQGTCLLYCGGFTYELYDIRFINADYRANFEWEWEVVLKFETGYILPESDTLPDYCVKEESYSLGINTTWCENTVLEFVRFAFNNIHPNTLEGSAATVMNSFGSSTVPYNTKRLTHKNGWMAVLIAGVVNKVSFLDGGENTNISYSAGFYGFSENGYVLIQHDLVQEPDGITVNGVNINQSESLESLTADSAKPGDWFYDNSSTTLTYRASAPPVNPTVRKKRSSPGIALHPERDFSMVLNAYKCYYPNCIPPPDHDTLAPADSRPNNLSYWDSLDWKPAETGMIWPEHETGNQWVWDGIGNGDPTDGPGDGDDVAILEDQWVIARNDISVRILLLYGVLEFENLDDVVYHIRAKYIIIMGGRLIIGWPDEPFAGEATIEMDGTDSFTLSLPNSPPAGLMSILVFGGFDMFGGEVGPTWTELSKTAEAGQDWLILRDDVSDWQPGWELVVGPTSYNAHEAEKVIIDKVDETNPRKVWLTSSLQHVHLFFNDQVHSYNISVGAGVALLTRKIKIKGINSPLKDHGCRILVSRSATRDRTYIGYARLLRAEISECGQYGFTESYDPRFGVAFLAVGNVSAAKPSFVNGSSIHSLYNTGIGAFGINGLNIVNNVIYSAVANGIQTNSDNTIISHNLIVLVWWSGTFSGRWEPKNFQYNEAGINVIDALGVTVTYNYVTGAERIGIYTWGIACEGVSLYTSETIPYRENTVVASLIGVGIIPQIEKASFITNCAYYTNFLIWFSHDYGIYYNQVVSAEFTNIILIENGMGFFPMVFAPPSLDHTCEEKLIFMNNSLIMGQTGTISSCSANANPVDTSNVQLSGQCRPPRGPHNTRIGVTGGNFISEGNNAGEKPFPNSMSYPADCGKTKFENLVFAYFNSGTGNCGSYAYVPNSLNEDHLHKVDFTSVLWVNVDQAQKLYFPLPDIKMVNSADCVDMDCDGLKKCLVRDTDGTFNGNGSHGDIFSYSELGYGINGPRGLGDWRIPDSMLTTPDGDRIEVNDIMPNKGIVRNDKCVYVTQWNAYKCENDLQHEFLLVENLDEDTETRRVSPLALRCHTYLDLINGPQDHGWCSGYTCRKRISTFWLIVVTDDGELSICELHFTGTTPLNLRFRLLNVVADKGIVLSIWYARPNRVDVWEGPDEYSLEYKMPTNGHEDEQTGDFKLEMSDGSNEDLFWPKLASVSGTNFVDLTTNLLHLTIKGSSVVEVHTKEVIIINFDIPPMSVAEFFGQNIVRNIAEFFGIDSSKVRLVNVVREKTAARKRRSATGQMTVSLEVGDPPDSGNSADASLTTERLLEITSIAVDECQTGNVSNITGLSATSCASVIPPSAAAAEDIIEYTTPLPNNLVFSTPPVAGYEGNALSTQPKIRVQDAVGAYVSELGTAEYPWRITATLRVVAGNSEATLLGNVTVDAENGWFNFTNLAISHMGSYIIDFAVVRPTSASNFILASDQITVMDRILEARLVSMTSFVVKDANFFIRLGLQDAFTKEAIENIAWKGHTWSATVETPTRSKYGNLTGGLTRAFDPNTGTIIFPDLTFSAIGPFYLMFTIVSSPADYTISFKKMVSALRPAHVTMTIEKTKVIEIKLDGDYNSLVPSEEKQGGLQQDVVQDLQNRFQGPMFTPRSVSRGSIYISFMASGSSVDVESLVTTLCDDISNSSTYTFDGTTLTLQPYMTVDGQTYYGTSCGDTSTSDTSHDEGVTTDSKSLEPWAIAVIAIGCLLLVGVVTAFLVWWFIFKPKSQTHTLFNSAGGDKVGRSGFSSKKYPDFLASQSSLNFSLKDGFNKRSTSPVVSVSSMNVAPWNKQGFREVSSISAGDLTLMETTQDLSFANTRHATPAFQNLLDHRSNSSLSSRVSPSPVSSSGQTPVSSNLSPTPSDNLEPKSNISTGNNLEARSNTVHDNHLGPRSSSSLSNTLEPRSHSTLSSNSFRSAVHGSFEERNSPLPPVGTEHHHGEYITTQASAVKPVKVKVMDNKSA